MGRLSLRIYLRFITIELRVLYCILEGSTPIKIGNEQFPEKLQRLAKVYGDLKKQSGALQLIDLDYTDRIIVNKN